MCAALDGPAGPELHRAVDPARDQSYFLFATTREQLDYLRFPLGGLQKPAVRRVAAELGLAVADKPDSQDICFVPEGRYTTIVDRLRPHGALAGDIVHLDGRVLGRHEGVTRYTVGQRRGLNVAVGEPLFVVRIDADAPRGDRRPARGAADTASLTLKETNWLGDAPTPGGGGRGRAAGAGPRALDPRAGAGSPGDARRARPASPSTRPEEGVAPGQACVLYDRGQPSPRAGRRLHRRGAALGRRVVVTARRR